MDLSYFPSRLHVQKRRGHMRGKKKPLSARKRVHFAENVKSDIDHSMSVESAADTDLTCRRCNANPACMPYVMPCGCVFCYFCLRTGLHERKGVDGQEMLYCLNCDAKVALLPQEDIDSTDDLLLRSIGAERYGKGDVGSIAKRI